MIRIGRQIPHFGGVDPTSIQTVFSDDHRFRYLLQVRYAGTLYDTGRDKRASVILKNPSAADASGADSTIRKVETFIYHHLPDVSDLAILNLFALRSTDASALMEEFMSRGELSVIGPENDRTIREVAGSSDYVVVAWGGRSGIGAALYSERVRKVRQILSGSGKFRIFEVVGDRETEEPLHGMMWGYEYRLVPCKRIM